MLGQRESDAHYARGWLALAVGSLIVAGAFAILLVVGRMPPFSAWVSDPLFFKRCLVVHVDLALVVWFYAFLGCLFFLLPTRRAARSPAALGLGLSIVGLLAMIGSVSLTGVEPILANYVPVLDHPLFVGGLAAFGLGLGLAFLDGRLLPGREAEQGVIALPAAARPGLRAAATAFILALLTFASGWLATPPEAIPQVRFELAFWGGGHVLQFASSAAMVSVWLILLHSALGEAPLGRRAAALGFGVFLLPLLAAPLLPLAGTDSGLAREGFTQLMRWGIFPVVSVVLLACLRSLWRAWRAGRLGWSAWADPRLTGFAVSAALTVLGFVLGALISGPNTMVPAHYHASIGAVTASFMAVSYLLLDPLGLPLGEGRLRRAAAWQPVLFGVGQMVFALGFGLAGAFGAARKAYGAEQAIRSTEQWVGLVVMGVGGLVAVAGGIAFLVIVGAAWRRRVLGGLTVALQEERDSWPKRTPSIPSRSC